MKKTILCLLAGTFVNISFSQQIYSPGGTIGTSSNSYIGIRKSDPIGALEIKVPCIDPGLVVTQDNTSNCSGFPPDPKGPFVLLKTIDPFGNSVTAFVVTSGGRVGIGRPTPGCNFEIAGSNNNYFQILDGVNSVLYVGKVSSSNNVGIGNNTPASKLSIRDGANINLYLGANTLAGYSGFTIRSTNDAGTTNNDLNFKASEFNFIDGHVVIGDVTTPNAGTNPATNYKLYVQSGILTEKVKVALKSTGDWSDFVFEDDYNLIPLDSVSTFIQENNHLPDIPSADCVVEEGIDLGQMDAKLLQKIEELTLYLIQLNDAYKKLEEEVQNLKSQN